MISIDGVPPATARGASAVTARHAAAARQRVKLDMRTSAHSRCDENCSLPQDPPRRPQGGAVIEQSIDTALKRHRALFHYSAKRSRRFSIVMTEDSTKPLPSDNRA